MCVSIIWKFVLLQGSIRYPVQELLTYELNIGKLRLYLHVCGHHL